MQGLSGGRWLSQTWTGGTCRALGSRSSCHCNKVVRSSSSAPEEAAIPRGRRHSKGQSGPCWLSLSGAGRLLAGPGRRKVPCHGRCGATAASACTSMTSTRGPAPRCRQTCSTVQWPPCNMRWCWPARSPSSPCSGRLQRKGGGARRIAAVRPASRGRHRQRASVMCMLIAHMPGSLAAVCACKSTSSLVSLAWSVVSTVEPSYATALWAGAVLAGLADGTCEPLRASL